jgi:hypothetical protein
VSQEANSSLKFNAFANQCGRAKSNSVMALVSDQSHKPCLVEYQKGTPSVKVVFDSDSFLPSSSSNSSK